MRKSSSLDALIAIAGRGTPFTDRFGQACIYVRAWNTSGFQYFPIRSRQFREWVYSEYYSAHEAIPTSHAFRTLLLHLEAQATSEPRNQRLSVFHRVGTHTPRYLPNEILLDLANSRREYVEITPSGWKTTTGHAFFRSSRSTDSLRAPDPRSHPSPSPVEQVTALPTQQSPTAPSLEPDAPSPNLQPPTPDPASEASLATLRSLLNLASRADWLRCLAWLLSVLRPYGPFPPLICQGPPSSGKTWAARTLRFLIDPSTVLLTPIPSSVHELLTVAQHNWILAFDHISTLSPNLTDALTRLSTGVGMTVRETGTPTSDPLLKSLSRPMLLTVTDRFQCPASLAERALTVNFAPLPPDRRRCEVELGAKLTNASPAILAALCNAVSTALRRLPEMSLPTGRAPDALAWAMAAAPALGCTEDEMRQALHDPPPPDPTVDAVRTLVDQHGTWTGSATDLLDLLPPSPHFRTAKGVSQHLKKHTLSLADLGIALKYRPTAKTRFIDFLPIPPLPVGQVGNLQADCQSASTNLSDSTKVASTEAVPIPNLPLDSQSDRQSSSGDPSNSAPADAPPPAPPQDASQNPEYPPQPTELKPLTVRAKTPPDPIPPTFVAQAVEPAEPSLVSPFLAAPDKR